MMPAHPLNGNELTHDNPFQKSNSLTLDHICMYQATIAKGTENKNTCTLLLQGHADPILAG